MMTPVTLNLLMPQATISARQGPPAAALDNVTCFRLTKMAGPTNSSKIVTPDSNAHTDFLGWKEPRCHAGTSKTPRP